MTTEHESQWIYHWAIDLQRELRLTWSGLQWLELLVELVVATGAGACESDRSGSTVFNYVEVPTDYLQDQPLDPELIVVEVTQTASTGLVHVRPACSGSEPEIVVAHLGGPA